MRRNKIIFRNFLALLLAACAKEPMQALQPSAQELEHHTVHVVACTEVSPFINGRCDDPSDKPLSVDVTIKDIYGNEITTGTTQNGETTLVFDTPQRAMFDLGYPRTTDDLAFCASATANEDKTEVTLAYSDCGALPQRRL